LSKGKLADVPRDIDAEPGDRRLIPPANRRRRVHSQGFGCTVDGCLEREPVLLQQAGQAQGSGKRLRVAQWPPEDAEGILAPLGRSTNEDGEGGQGHAIIYLLTRYITTL
jgi:hypothetical protein